MILLFYETLRGAAFIFIGGVQPKKITLDGPRRPCPSCGQGSLRWVRRDLYLSLFFLPVFPVKTGQPYLECEQCGRGFDPAAMDQAQALAALRPAAAAAPALPAEDDRPQLPPPAKPGAGETADRCRFCGGRLQPGFKYCPFCGARI